MSQQNNSPHPQGGYTNSNQTWMYAEFFASLFSKTIEVFLRNDFGARYFNISDFFGSSLTLILFFGFAVIFKALSQTQSATPLGLFFLGFSVMTAVHLFTAYTKNRSGRRWHSRYSGTSYLGIFYPSNPYIIKRYVEPLVAVIVGAVIVSIDAPLGAWIMLAGVCLATTEQLAAMRARDRIFDALDAQIEAKHLAEVIKGTPDPEQTEGFALPVPTYFNDEQRSALYTGMTTLDPALQAILDPPEPVTATPPPKAHAEKSDTEREIEQMLDNLEGGNHGR